MDWEEITRRLTALEAAAHQAVRVGFVVEVLEAEGRVRVRLPDADCIETQPLPVLYPKTYLDKHYLMPDVGEQVVCLFANLGGHLEHGFVLGAIYSEPDPVPVADRNKTHVRFADGTWIEYDRAVGKLMICCAREVEIQAKEQITLRCPSVDFYPEAPCELHPAEPRELEDCDAGE